MIFSHGGAPPHSRPKQNGARWKNCVELLTHAEGGTLELCGEFSHGYDAVHCRSNFRKSNAMGGKAWWCGSKADPSLRS